VSDAQLVVVAVHLDASLSVLERLAPLTTAARLVTDVGSTKARIGEAARRLGMTDRFVGSHPFAGDHRSGWRASRTGLFAGARVFLCPAPDTPGATTQLASALWASLGAQPELIDAAEHDVVLGWTSHLPQVLSSTFALALARRGIDRAQLGPGGRDVARLAGGSPAMWSAIGTDNAAVIDEALAVAEREIGAWRTALRARDTSTLRARFAEASDWFWR
jgi:prephenate dehydrogenase